MTSTILFRNFMHETYTGHVCLCACDCVCAMCCLMHMLLLLLMLSLEYCDNKRSVWCVYKRFTNGYHNETTTPFRLCLCTLLAYRRLYKVFTHVPVFSIHSFFILVHSRVQLYIPSVRGLLAIYSRVPIFGRNYYEFDVTDFAQYFHIITKLKLCYNFFYVALHRSGKAIIEIFFFFLL